MRRTHRAPLFGLAIFGLVLLTLGAGRAGAVEAIVNGGFATGIAPWYVAEGIDPSWDPVDAATGAVSLHPPASSAMGGYMGPVLSQPLNVTGIGGQTLTAAVDLWVVNGDLTSTMPMVAITIEYIDGNGQFHTATVLQSSLQEIGQSDASNPSHQQASPFVFPTDAARLVEVSLVKLGYGEVMADNVSLDITNATVGPVPQITGISPASLAYGDTLTITGQNFGTSQGTSQVLLDNSPAGLTVQSWSDTSITVQVNAPAVPGALVVQTDTESNPVPGPEITSPYFRITTAFQPDQMTILAGTTVRLPLGVIFMNGYTLPAGQAITWTLVDLSGATPPTHHFTPATLSGPGGTLLTVDTTNVTPGHYEFEVHASDGTNVVTGRAEVEIWKIGQAEFFDPATQHVITNLTVTQQGEFGQDIEMRLFDTNGNQIPEPGPLAPFQIQSDNPAVVLVHQTFDDVKLYAVASGQANLTITFVDGFTAILPVTVTLPDAPHVTMALSPATITNKQAGPVTFTATGVDSLTHTGFSASFLQMTEDAANCGYNQDYTQYACDYTVDLASPHTFPTPGVSFALFHATAASGSATATGYALLTVTNDSSYAGMEGVVASLDPTLPMQDLEMGTFEFYAPDDTTTPVFSRQLIGTPTPDGHYKMGGVTPGTYLVRYTTMSGMEGWYPGSPDPANAQPVSFTAGQWTTEINFLFLGQGNGTGGTGGAPEGDVILTPDKVEGPAPLTVNFDCAADPASGITMGTAGFDFDRDGTYDETGNTTGTTSHTYETPGTYDVVCSITDAGTGTTTESNPKTITVTDGTGGTGGAPEGDVILTPDKVEGPAPLTVNFDCAADPASGITMGTAGFDFDRDGTYDETGNTTGTTSHTYETPGTYDVVCSITDAGTGTTTESNPKTITVTESTGGTGGTGGPDISKWDCNGNGVVDLPDILCQLRLLAKGGAQP